LGEERGEGRTKSQLTGENLSKKKAKKKKKSAGELGGKRGGLRKLFVEGEDGVRIQRSPSKRRLGEGKARKSPIPDRKFGKNREVSPEHRIEPREHALAKKGLHPERGEIVWEKRFSRDSIEVATSKNKVINSTFFLYKLLGEGKKLYLQV